MGHGRMYVSAIVASGLVSGAPLRSIDALGQIPGSIESAPRAPATVANTIRLQIIVYPRTGADGGSVKLARKVAGELLDSGGILVEWREDILGVGEPSPGVVPVLLLPIRKASKRGVSGEVARNADTQRPMVLVYMAQIADLLCDIRGRAVGLGHVVG